MKGRRVSIPSLGVTGILTFSVLVLTFFEPLSGQAAAAPAGPGDHVAFLIREAMRAPDRTESWSRLALGLQTVEARDPEGLRAAIQVADSLARNAGASGVEGLGLELETGVWISRALGASPFGLLLPGMLLGLLLATGFMSLRSGRWTAGWGALRRDPRGAPEGDTPTAVRAPSPPPNGRDFALALARSGLPASEVARQTGLAQDGLAVLLALHGRPEGEWSEGSLEGRG